LCRSVVRRRRPDEGTRTIHAFRRLKNCVCVKIRSKDLQVWARLDPSTVTLEDGFTRDVSEIGHAGTGDLEIRIQSAGFLRNALRSWRTCMETTSAASSGANVTPVDQHRWLLLTHWA
jgi:predicted transport protein